MISIHVVERDQNNSSSLDYMSVFKSDLIWAPFSSPITSTAEAHAIIVD